MKMDKQTVIIKEVIWYPIHPTEKGLIGFASLLCGTLLLSFIAVYTRPNGDYRLLFPNARLPNGKEISIYHPMDTETYDMILQAVVKKIETVTKGVSNEYRLDD